MKKLTTLLIVLTIGISFSFAQSFAFYQGEEELLNNAEIAVSEVTTDGPRRVIESNIKVKNNSESEVEFTITQTILTAPLKGNLSFCFGQCIDGNDDLLQTQPIPANNFHGLFHLSLILPDLGMATARVKYEMYVKDNPDEKKTVIVNYNSSPTGSTQNDYSENSLSVYQNGNSVTLNYDLQQVSDAVGLYVYNATGVIVSQETLSNNQGTLNLPYLSKGVYIAVIKQGDKSVSLQKFMIR